MTNNWKNFQYTVRHKDRKKEVTKDINCTSDDE